MDIDNNSYIKIRINQLENCLRELSELDKTDRITIDHSLLKEAVKIGDGFLAAVATTPSLERIHKEREIYDKYNVWGWLRRIYNVRKMIEELRMIDVGKHININKDKNTVHREPVFLIWFLGSDKVWHPTNIEISAPNRTVAIQHAKELYQEDNVDAVRYGT